MEQGDSGLFPKSTFTPPTMSMPVEVLAFENAVLKDIEEMNSNNLKVFHNTCKEEWRIIEELGSDLPITIKTC